jgi:hypothetical protein
MTRHVVVGFPVTADGNQAEAAAASQATATTGGAAAAAAGALKLHGAALGSGCDQRPDRMKSAAQQENLSGAEVGSGDLSLRRKRDAHVSYHWSFLSPRKPTKAPRHCPRLSRLPCLTGGRWLVYFGSPLGKLIHSPPGRWPLMA